MTYDVARSQRSKPFGFARGPVCAPPEWPCDALEGQKRAPHGGRGLLISPQRPSASPVSLSTATGDLSTRIGLVEDEGKSSRPKQA
jgi:hypothetical protein